MRELGRAQGRLFASLRKVPDRVGHEGVALDRVRVVTDSTADMDEAEAERLGIVVVPLSVQWGGDTYLDKVELSLDDFYKMLRERKGLPTTSQPPVGRFVETYSRLLGEAEHVISVHITAKASGTVNAARMAAERFGPNRVAVIDSKNISDSLGCLAVRIAEAAKGGASFQECINLVEDLVPRLRLFAAMDTLEFLRRGGRVSRFQAFAGGLLSIKPIVHLVDGEILPADRVRTRSAAVKRVAEMIVGLGPLEEAAVLYGDDPKPADDVHALLNEMAPGLPIRRGRTGSVIGTHTGPGVFGATAVLQRS